MKTHKLFNQSYIGKKNNLRILDLYLHFSDFVSGDFVFGDRFELAVRSVLFRLFYVKLISIFFVVEILERSYFGQQGLSNVHLND